ncbi:hypothetical protein HSX37_04870|uniref:Uncharacterized protein n=1 Tax=Dendrosporobacter quercicolus TaxID=146817 RepID=A0A1G9NLF7_9FIRM|nr:CBO0543 family protein [Dendrosporobacter quercicolus]NSL47376.1 hypothetical protein [Dendrosporobacter quercicolus DSM 1736]SDL87219.1 hypothetical protein SAMN04488502_1011051 [Dendrosporobacter quercicolus]
MKGVNLIFTIEYTSIEATKQAQEILTQIKIEHWLNEEVFRIQWWIQVVVLIVPWFIWWKLVNKQKLVEIFCYGLLIGIVAVLLDGLGVELTLWGYPHKLFPLLERLFHADLTALPVIFMLIYQYFPKWKAFLGVCTLVAAIFTFVVEPIHIGLNIYELYSWKSIYSFPIYVALAACCKWLLGLIIKEQKPPQNVSE